MEKMLFKTFRAEVKAYDDRLGTVDMVIPMSTASRDRDGEIIEPTAFKRTLKDFMRRPVLLSSHNYMDLRKQIGEFKSLKVTDAGLEAHGIKYYVGEGNEEADWAYKLAARGVAAFSVGFIPQEEEIIDPEKPEGYGNRKFTDVELLEISQVCIPSNRDAIQGLRSKAAADPVVTALMDAAEKAEGLLPAVAKSPTKTTEAAAPVVTGIPETKSPATAAPAPQAATVSAGEWTDIVGKPYTNEHACRLRQPGDFEEDSFRRMTREHEGKKYACVMGRLKGEKTMTEQAYRYDKDVWEMAQARAHCKAADGTFEAATGEAESHKLKAVSQAELADELAYLLDVLGRNGLAAENRPAALALATELRRLSGGDTPVEDKTHDPAEPTAEEIAALVAETIRAEIGGTSG